MHYLINVLRMLLTVFKWWLKWNLKNFNVKRIESLPNKGCLKIPFFKVSSGKLCIVWFNELLTAVHSIYNWSMAINSGKDETTLGALSFTLKKKQFLK